MDDKLEFPVYLSDANPHQQPPEPPDPAGRAPAKPQVGAKTPERCETGKDTDRRHSEAEELLIRAVKDNLDRSKDLPPELGKAMDDPAHSVE